MFGMMGEMMENMVSENFSFSNKLITIQIDYHHEQNVSE